MANTAIRIRDGKWNQKPLEMEDSADEQRKRERRERREAEGGDSVQIRRMSVKHSRHEQE